MKCSWKLLDERGAGGRQTEGVREQPAAAVGGVLFVVGVDGDAVNVRVISRDACGVDEALDRAAADNPDMAGLIVIHSLNRCGGSHGTCQSNEELITFCWEQTSSVLSQNHCGQTKDVAVCRDAFDRNTLTVHCLATSETVKQ